MKTVLVLLALVRSLAAQTPQSLAAELRRLEHAIQIGQTPELPAEWRAGEYTISSQALREILEREPGSPKAAAWLEDVARHLEGFATRAAEPDARAQLDRILSRREFAAAGPPNAWERFRDRVVAWVQQVLSRLFGLAAEHPTGSAILFWIGVSAAVGFVALTLFRFWAREQTGGGLPAPAIRSAARSWQEWKRAAHHAAEQGDAREAIRCAYWAAIVKLQAEEALPAEQTRTPREYLGAMGGARRAPLAGLTSQLERFWYAGQPASLEDFQESLRDLAALEA